MTERFIQTAHRSVEEALASYPAHPRTHLPEVPLGVPVVESTQQQGAYRYAYTLPSCLHDRVSLVMLEPGTYICSACEAALAPPEGIPVGPDQQPEGAPIPEPPPSEG